MTELTIFKTAKMQKQIILIIKIRRTMTFSKIRYSMKEYKSKFLNNFNNPKL